MPSKSTSKLLFTLDWLQIGCIAALLAFSIAILFSFSAPPGIGMGWTQIIFAALGLSLMTVMIFTDYRSWQGVAWWLYLAGIILLIAVFIWGTKSFGARRWIDWGLIEFQPSEIVKIIFIIFLARFLAERESFSFKHIVYLLIFLAIPLGLILVQPDLGTASVYVIIFLGILLVSPLPRWFWLIFLAIAIICLPLIWLNLRDYQKQRLITFLEPDKASPSASYNVSQSIIAIGSGGLIGRGLGQGTQSQLKFLPVAYSDFIFAGIAEATGFSGSVFLILIELILVYRCVKTAELSQDEFGRYFAVGMAVLILYQVSINIGGNLGLVPVTGIPLPLVSFGGTGLISYLIGLGIVQSVYLRHRKLTFV